MAVYQGITLALVRQDIENNTSTVSFLWQTTQTAGSYNHYEQQARYTVTGPTGAKTYTVAYRLQKNTTHPILETVLTVPHAQDGTGFVTVDTWLDSGISAGIIQLQEKLQLPTIPRASTIAATDAPIGAVSALVVSRKDPRFTHTIALSFGDIQGYLDANGALTQDPVQLSATSLAFFVPEDFYDQIPDAPSGICALKCTTYLGSTQIGESQGAEFTVTADPARCGPTMTWSVLDGSAAVELTGDSHVFVRYVSKALCSVNAQARCGAKLVGCTAGGKAVPTTHVVMLQDIHGGSILLRAWDSRGFVTQVQVPLQMVEYIPLTCEARLQRKDPTSGDATLTLSGKYFGGSFGAAHNALTLSCVIDDREPVALTPEWTDDGYKATLDITGLDYRYGHTARVTATDRCMSAVAEAAVSKGIPVFHWGENDFAFHVPVYMEAGFKVGGAGLVDMVYPVGSIYLALHQEDPGDLFGGTWQRIYGRFLWAAELTDTIGSQGGEKTHTLTVAELPSHHHTGVRRSDSAVAGGVSQAASAGGNDTDYRTDNTGGSQPHNNMPPYIAVYAWRRTG